jgi:glycosyltransferase involved in cell wall biosynthesis
MLKKYAGKYFDYDDNAKVAFHIVSADHFKPIEGKKNILLTMWEFDELPKTYIEAIQKADALIVPSSYCKEVFQRHYHKPISVCWEGIEPEMYPYKERSIPRNGEKLRILWLGAPNPRKGYQVVQGLIQAFQKVKDVEIYIKTTIKKTTWRYALSYFLRNWKRICIEDGKPISLKRMLLKVPTPSLYNTVKVYGDNKTVIFDTRKLPYEQMKDLYHSAHIFVFPSFGEGWGLPLCEAMATGCPCIGVDYTGCRDFFDTSVGYNLKHKIFLDKLKNYGNLEVGVRVPDVSDLLTKIIYVAQHYSEALKKAKKASERIHSKFTWEKSGKRLYEIIRGEYVN